MENIAFDGGAPEQLDLESADRARDAAQHGHLLAAGFALDLPALADEEASRRAARP